MAIYATRTFLNTSTNINKILTKINFKNAINNCIEKDIILAKVLNKIRHLYIFF